MAGTDRAGNQSDVVIINRAKHDFTYPIFYDLKPDANQWIRKLDLAYTLQDLTLVGLYLDMLAENLILMVNI